MPWTKRQFIEKAYEELGMSDYFADLTPDQIESAMWRLDAMMATWNAAGIRIGYPIPSNPNDSDLDQDTAVPDSANEAILLNLAVKLAPGFGKQTFSDTKAGARNAYDGLLALAAKPNQKQLPTTMPTGAGQKGWREGNSGIFYPDPVNRLEAGHDSTFHFE